ncbi:dsRBD fold-containing protein [Nocardiopsis sp. NRRL B-16309]|uniref:dsRBD fold-containing protein n=1 Tax=Nocardiopsis sp. NRRL B-16309 TaxID=1519494 RepID=UPI0009EB2A43|nr:dsRBD fold-containing protein [Nocardiopsis sp. NRRL B-16309]
MRAEVGDRLVVESPRADTHRRTGVVTKVQGDGGSPPYQVHWLDAVGGHDALVYPGPDAHIEHRPGRTGADTEETQAMQTMKRWDVDVVVAEETEGDTARTWAEVGLVADDGTALRGHGMSRKHPADLDVPEIGEELAVSRALSDLSRQLRQVAAEDINDNTGTPWRPT